MIFDILDNIGKYRDIANLNEIQGFIKNNDIVKLPDGDIEIKGADLFVKVLRYNPRPAAEIDFEIHKIYTDVQIVFRGPEKMQIVGADNLSKITEYEKEKDFQLFSAKNEISDIIVRENEFIVFFPGDAHKPGCHYIDLNEPVLKLVFKTKGAKKRR